MQHTKNKEEVLPNGSTVTGRRIATETVISLSGRQGHVIFNSLAPMQQQELLQRLLTLDSPQIS